MATLLQLDQAGVLDRIDPGLERGTMEVRLIYALPRLRDWLEGPVHDLQSHLEQSPAEQVATIIEDFCSGATLVIGPHLNMLDHVDGGMWKLKTYDTRIFGWFAKRDVFVGVCGHSTTHVKQHGLYHGIAGEVGRARDALDLDPPKFIPGDSPYGVVSNYSFP